MKKVLLLIFCVALLVLLNINLNPEAFAQDSKDDDWAVSIDMTDAPLVKGIKKAHKDRKDKNKAVPKKTHNPSKKQDSGKKWKKDR